MNYVQRKWPASPVQRELIDQYNRRKALSVIDSCLKFKEGVVVLPSLRRIVLKQFHSNHPGTNRMKSIARRYAFWPGMDKDIDMLVKDCLKWQLASKGPPRENPTPWPETKKKHGVDLAGPIIGVTYLVLVYSHSQITRGYYNIADKCFGYVQCSSQHILYPWYTGNYCVGQRDTTPFCSFKGILQEPCNWTNRSPHSHLQSIGQVEKFVSILKWDLLKTKRGRSNGKINKRIPHHIQDKRPSKSQWKVTCRSIDGKNSPNN